MPVIYLDSANIETHAPPIVSLGRELWDKLFLQVSSEGQHQSWEKELSSLLCDCNRTYSEFKESNPPTYPLPFSWKYNLKSAVNAKLGKPNLSFEEAFELYYGPA